MWWQWTRNNYQETSDSRTEVVVRTEWTRRQRWAQKERRNDQAHRATRQRCSGRVQQWRLTEWPGVAQVGNKLLKIPIAKNVQCEPARQCQSSQFFFCHKIFNWRAKAGNDNISRAHWWTCRSDCHAWNGPAWAPKWGTTMSWAESASATRTRPCGGNDANPTRDGEISPRGQERTLWSQVGDGETSGGHEPVGVARAHHERLASGVQCQRDH